MNDLATNQDSARPTRRRNEFVLVALLRTFVALHQWLQTSSLEPTKATSVIAVIVEEGEIIP
jgi:hypothetical protein